MAVLNSAALKSRPIEVLAKISMKFLRPMKLAVSKPVWVDQVLKLSQMVSSIGMRMKTPISPVAGASMMMADRCVACMFLVGLLAAVAKAPHPRHLSPKGRGGVGARSCHRVTSPLGERSVRRTG